jgi:succinate dehydrogenase / fumarate reductase flavoprotein subunit
VENEMAHYMAHEGREKAGVIRQELQDAMQEHCGVFREKEGLATLVNTIRELQERFEHVGLEDKTKAYNTELCELIELKHMLDFSEVIAVSGLAREECRGAHWRTDFIGRNDEEWHKHTLAFKKPDGTIELKYKPVVITKYPPEARKY